jgi:hypothetical protein
MLLRCCDVCKSKCCSWWSRWWYGIEDCVFADKVVVVGMKLVCGGWFWKVFAWFWISLQFIHLTICDYLLYYLTTCYGIFCFNAYSLLCILVFHLLLQR